MSTHTPGPWFARYGALGWHVDTQEWSLDDLPKVDAHLIAAAPDMLTALNAVRIWMKNIDRRPTEEPLYNAIRTAIAKAEGTS